jgi:hypothetical protein
VTHKKGGEHGYEHNSIVVPKCIRSENKKALGEFDQENILCREIRGDTFRGNE